MKTRYTHKALEADIIPLNEKLARWGHELRFVVERRNGYVAIDLATPEQMARHCCQRMLIGGTARECLTECEAYLGRVAK
jgi:hypothetical protein